MRFTYLLLTVLYSCCRLSPKLTMKSHLSANETMHLARTFQRTNYNCKQTYLAPSVSLLIDKYWREIKFFFNTLSTHGTCRQSYEPIASGNVRSAPSSHLYGLLLVSLLIGWESGLRFFSQSNLLILYAIIWTNHIWHGSIYAWLAKNTGKIGMFCSVACGVCTQAIVLALHLIGLKVGERFFEPITCIIKQSTN